MPKDEIVKWMTGSAVPAIHLAATTGKSWSKIGGTPTLPQSQVWPSWNGVPLSFLAQIDFAEVSAVNKLPGFPDSGRAFFFYDQEQSTWGFDPKDRGSWVVIYTEDENEAPRLSIPTGINELGLFVEKPVAFRAITSVPDIARKVDVDFQSFSEQDFDELHKLKSDCFEDLQRHQLGGYPSAIQSDTMELECQLASNGLNCGDASGFEDPKATALKEGSSDWLLLLQLDSDADTGMMWGDMGTVFFWIRRQDLAKRDFSMVWMILQCG